VAKLRAAASAACRVGVSSSNNHRVSVVTEPANFSENLRQVSWWTSRKGRASSWTGGGAADDAAACSSIPSRTGSIGTA
jgi:hypothetical protein